MKKFSYKEGDIFRRTDFGNSDVTIESVQTHRKDATGKNGKLPDPILHLGYSEKDNKIQMYASDADRLIHFERWKFKTP